MAGHSGGARSISSAGETSRGTVKEVRGQGWLEGERIQGCSGEGDLPQPHGVGMPDIQLCKKNNQEWESVLSCSLQPHSH